MTSNILKFSALLIPLLSPIVGHPQGIVGGATNGADAGNAAAGPAGAVVGGVSGGIDGLLGIDQRPRFRYYARREQRPSYQYQEEVREGAILPQGGLEYYEVPPEHGVRGLSLRYWQ